jgi:O-antigen/teichoic acid export membrane protein
MDDRDTAGTGRFEVRTFGKDALIYSAGNGLLVIFGFIQTLIIPKYLSVEGYGYWQLFLLYGSYVGILHLGFLDGLLLRWAGKDFSQIGGEIKPALGFLVFEQLAVIISLGLIFYILLKPPFQWIGLMLFIYAFIYNLVTFFIFTMQATRQFTLLTALAVGNGFIFLSFITPFFITGHTEYNYVIIAWMTAYVLYLFALAFHYRRYLWKGTSHAPSPTVLGKTNINVGVFILLGNFVFVIFWTLDRLLVSSFFTIEQFATYAFAMTVA